MDSSRVLTLSDERSEEQLQEIVKFLRFTHPGLSDDTYVSRKACVEIRPISRCGYNYTLSRSLNLWNLNESSVERLRQFLALHNGTEYCLYYSVFAFNYDKAFTITPSGQKRKKGKVNSTAALFHNEIALDFDNLSRNEFQELYDRFNEIGLDGLWVYSGHGIQVHLKLNELCQDNSILKKLVYKFRSKGFKCDETCVDPARVMRLPFTYNCKCFAESQYSYEQANPPFCEILHHCEETYSVEEIFSKLDVLDTVSPADERVLYDLFAEASPYKRNIGLLPTAEVSELFELQQIVYPHIVRFELPEPVRKMLISVPVGFRNKVFGFLVKYFKMHLRLGKNHIKEIMVIWSSQACDVPYDSKVFDYDFERFYYKGGLPYDNELAGRFGYIDFEAQIELRRKNIYIPSSFIRSFGNTDGTVVRLYLGIKLLEHIEEPTTIEKLSSVLGVSEPMVKKYISAAKECDHIYVKKGYKKAGIPNEYRSTKIVSFSEGYFSLSYNDVQAYLSQLNVGEIKLYVFMRYKFYSGEVFMAQSNLGVNIGLQQNTVSVLTKSLQKKYFLKITKKYISNNIYSCIYTLLR